VARRRGVTKAFDLRIRFGDAAQSRNNQRCGALFCAMKRGFHELSDDEISDVADELMLPTGVFGAILVAGVMCLALIWHPLGLFDRSANPPAAVAMRPGTEFLSPKPAHPSGRQASQAQNIAPD
jgi:hypothetical protein